MTRRRAIAWRVVAAGLALACVSCLVVWAHDDVPAPSDPAVSNPAASIERTPPSSEPGPAGRATGEVSVTAPVGLRIDAIGVATRLVRLGLRPDGTVETPDSDPDQAGWFEPGTRPGDTGSAVILGHVDSLQGPAVFARLADLGRGDRVRVRGAGGTHLDFEVRTVETYANADFPARRVYARAGGVRLNLVTCGGAYDADRGGYQANVVVYTRLVGSSA